MAGRTRARSRARSAAAAGPKPDFHRQTVLFQWALAKFGVSDLAHFRERFPIGPDRAEGLNEHTGRHRFFEAIANVLPTVADGGTIAVDRLVEYEQNLLEHTQVINTSRLHHGQPTIVWKYHQYLALLFTELFLDHYFHDAGALRDEINARIVSHNQSAPSVDDRVDAYATEESPRDQLARLAFWCATGSGKTLLMHMHVRQFRQYHGRAFAAGRWPKLDQIILVTPNEGLSRQHTEEFEQSGFDVAVVGEHGVDGLFAEQYRGAIKILDIHKFRDEHGPGTVATESFEGCNLVLVDEGHRGAGSGKEGAWVSRRDELSKSGFCFEYSATFKEAVQGDEEMRNRYARCILFDYAYRSFYRDGYGKDFTILNLEDDDKQRRYLTAALLLFYQQIKVWRDGGGALRAFQIDKPLWIFVGHTVVGKASSSDDKESVSDVVEVLLFLRDFLADPNESIERIRNLLEEGFRDQQERNLLAHRLPHLDVSGDKATLARTLHAGILRDVFNAPAGGSLSVRMLKAADGELALRVGEGEPFGVVNVGDPVAVADACETKGIGRDADDQNRPSLFHGINRDDSPINLLVGSRKFTEGWNSWRVSSIGLMRMGKNEGTQIVQLFGRGVRLKGYGMSLRRSSVLSVKPTPAPNMRQVETLQVFGVKANYMNTFRDWIFSEVPEAQERQIWDLPVVRKCPWPNLKTLRLRDVIDGVSTKGQGPGDYAFRKLGPLVVLRPPHETDPADEWLCRHRSRLNWLPRVRGFSGADRQITATIGETVEAPQQTLKNIPRFFFDVDELLFEMEAFKAGRGLDRLHVTREAISALLDRDNWYTLYAAAEDMRLDRYENRDQWNRMARQLLSSYAERFYRFMRNRWEAPYLEVVDVDSDDPSLIESYTIETTDRVQTAAEIERIGNFVEDLKRALETNQLAPWSQFGGRWRTVPFGGHLFQPLLYVGKNAEIRISPVALNEHEGKFVADLADWCGRNAGTEVYLLRNQAVTGLGFFQAGNFFPDFLMWLQDGQTQHLAFIDPKGLHHLDPSDAKIQFATRDLPRLQAIVNRQCPTLRLHAFILSSTSYSNLIWSGGGQTRMEKAEIEALGVLFQVDDATTYVSTLMSRLR